jgi:heme-degrading monooxygenase HmoA
MYVAMNRFKVVKETAAQFEKLWAERESHLHEVPGFQGFHMLRGPEHADHILYASHTIWSSEADFLAWTKSEQFRKAHANAGASDVKPLYLEPPAFEGFNAIQEVAKDGTKRLID